MRIGIIQGDLWKYDKFVSHVRNVEYLGIDELETHLTTQFDNNCDAIVTKDTDEIPNLPQKYLTVLTSKYLQNQQQKQQATSNGSCRYCGSYY